MADDYPVITDYKFRNDIHSLFLIIIMATMILGIGWLMATSLGLSWIIFAGLIIFISWPKFSAQRILNAYAAKKISVNDETDILSKICYLSHNAGLKKIPKIYFSELDISSAFTMKVDNENIIVVTHKLTKALNHSELLAILAHEVSHIYHDDINVMLLTDRMSQLTQTLTAITLIMLALTPFLNLQNIVTPWPLIMYLLIAHYLTGILQLSLSRTREFYADVIAVQLTNDIKPMISALKKIEDMHTGWLNSMIRSSKTYTTPSLLRSHPSTQDRIRHLLGLDMLSSFGHRKIKHNSKSRLSD